MSTSSPCITCHPGGFFRQNVFTVDDVRFVLHPAQEVSVVAGAVSPGHMSTFPLKGEAQHLPATRGHHLTRLGVFAHAPADQHLRPPDPANTLSQRKGLLLNNSHLQYFTRDKSRQV